MIEDAPEPAPSEPLASSERVMGDDDEPYDPSETAKARELAGAAHLELGRLVPFIEGGDPRQLAGAFAIALGGAEDELRAVSARRHLRRLLENAGQDLARNEVASAVKALAAARELAPLLARGGPDTFTAAEALASTDEIAFLCEGLQLCPGRPPVMVGYAGDGKTTAALSAGLAWALGGDAWGTATLRPARRLRVSFADLDMGLVAARIRVREVLQLEGRTAKDLEGSVFVGVDGRKRGLRLRCTGPRDVPTPADRAAFVGAWRAHCAEYDLTILDNLRKLTPDQNLDSDPRGCIALDLLEEVTTETGSVVWVMAHSAKGNKGPLQALKGKADLEGSSGAISVLWRDEDGRRHFQLTRGAALRWAPLLGYLDFRELGLTLTPDQEAAFRPIAERRGSKASPAERDATKRRADDDAARGLIAQVVKAVNAARDAGLTAREVRVAVGGTGTIIDKARLIALQDLLIYDRKVGAYPRYYGPSYLPPEPAQLPLDASKPRR